MTLRERIAYNLGITLAIVGIAGGMYALSLAALAGATWVCQLLEMC